MTWIPDEHYQNATVAREYDRRRFSSLAGRIFNHLEKRTITRCFARLPPGACIADVPCGTGRIAEALLEAGHRVHGLDISRQMLDVADARLRRFGDRFTSAVADAKQLRPDTPVCDGALCARVLMHFPLDQQVAFLTGVARLTRGIVVINHSLDSPYQRLRRRVKRWLHHQVPALHPISNHDLRTLLRESGLREVARHRLVSLISEAIYIVAEKPAPAGSAPAKRAS